MSSLIEKIMQVTLIFTELIGYYLRELRQITIRIRKITLVSFNFF